jgi:RNA polymerase sigma factor (sigma-70 family)
MIPMSWPKSSSKSSTPHAAEFDRLMRDHVPALFRSAHRWTGSIERAEDLVQEVLVRLYPKLDELREIDRLRPWTVRVMYRVFVDQLRRERSGPVIYGVDLHGDEDAELIDESQEPPSLAEQQFTRERIALAWAQLSDEHRVVLSMHDIEGYSLVELSPLLDIPLGTLKSRIHRARAKLRELLVAERFSTSERVCD